MRAEGLTMGWVEWWLLILLAILWGTTFFWAEIALRELPPFTIVLARVGIAAALLTLFVYAAGYRLPSTPGGQAAGGVKQVCRERPGPWTPTCSWLIQRKCPPLTLPCW